MTKSRTSRGNAGHLIKKRLSAGTRLVIIGWSDVLHTPFTKSIPEEQILFLGKPRKGISKSNTWVVMTTSLTNKDIANFRTWGFDFYQKALEPETIRNILLDNESLIKKRKPKPKKTKKVTPKKTVIVPVVKEKKMNRFAQLAAAFDGPHAVRKDWYKKGKLIGSRSIAKVLEEIGFDQKAPELVTLGLLEQITQPNKGKAGWYAPTEDLLKAKSSSNIDDEPSDEKEYAAWLFENEEALRQKLIEVERVAKDLRKKIETLDTIKSALKG